NKMTTKEIRGAKQSPRRFVARLRDKKFSLPQFFRTGRPHWEARRLESGEQWLPIRPKCRRAAGGPRFGFSSFVYSFISNFCQIGWLGPTFSSMEHLNPG